jgi:hypothetical protein
LQEFDSFVEPEERKKALDEALVISKEISDLE